MTEPISYTVDGVPETTAAFREFAAQVANDEAAANKAAGLIAAQARGIAPVVSGLLSGGYAAAGRFIVNPVPYAHIVEYGSVYMSGQYIIARSVDAVVEDVVNVYADFVQEKADGVGFERG